MKKIIAAITCIVMMSLMALSTFAADVPSADLQREAASLNLGADVQGSISDMAALHANGVRLFDAGALIPDADKNAVEERLGDVSAETGFDTIIVTTDGLSGYDEVGKYADYIYSTAQFGTGESRDGSMLVVDLVDGDVYIYTYGAAIACVTDNEQNYIYDELDGGLINAIRSGDNTKACMIFAAGVKDGYLNGPDEPKKKSLSIVEILISLVVSGLAGILPVNSIKSKYAMKSEKHLAQGFNLAYRANSKLALQKGVVAAPLISRNVTRAPIPVQKSGNGGSGHGGGSSTTHTSIGGGVHGGTGRKL